MSVVTGDVEPDEAAGLDGIAEPHGGKIFRPAPTPALGQHERSRPDVPIEMAGQSGITGMAKPRGPSLDDVSRHGRHAGRGRSGPR